MVGRIDYEAVQSISFTASASDRESGLLARTTVQQFTVSVININDNGPRFSQPYYEAELRENVTSRQTVVSVLATDLDLSPYGDVRYARVGYPSKSSVLFKLE